MTRKPIVQNWVVGDVPEACIPIGDSTATEHGLPDIVEVVRARTAEEAIDKAASAARRKIKIAL